MERDHPIQVGAESRSRWEWERLIEETERRISSLLKVRDTNLSYDPEYDVKDLKIEHAKAFILSVREALDRAAADED